MDGLTIVVAGIVSLLSLVVGYLLRKYFGEAKIASAEQEANKILEDATRQAESIKKEARVEVKDDLHKLRTETENELKERRQEVLQLEKRLVQKEETLDQKEAAVSQREQSVSDKEEHYRAVLDEAEEAKAKQERVLEELSGLSRSEAREVLLKHAEEETRHDMAKMVRAVEGEAKREGERRARNVLSLSIQRTARSLDGQGQDIASTPLPLSLGLTLHSTHHFGHIMPRLFLCMLQKDFPCLRPAEAGQLFKHPLLLGLGLLRFIQDGPVVLLLIAN